jgi:tungstate transport system substrate-binding protein
VFASRGDESGTHVRELELWQAAGLAPDAARDAWYRDTGSGMLPTLMVALELDGYTLIDRATWDTTEQRGSHRIVYAGDPALVNHYSLILVDPANHPHVQAAAAQTFVTWMRGADGQAAIANFKPRGHQLFFPSVVP